jgi:hypothetical protein
MAFSVYLVTPITKARYIPTEFLHPTSRYFITPIEKARYFSTIPYKITSRYFVTPISKSRFISVSGDPDPDDVKARYLPPVDYPQAPTLDFPNECHYPTELDLIRQKATLLIWEFVENNLYSTIGKEAWGKKDVKGYYDAGNLRILLDYLSSIWIEKDTDSRSGLVRTADYYYTKYNIAEIIDNFRNCDLNIKEIVALFNLNSYTIIDGDWPNYFVINSIINQPQQGDTTLKQYTDIFTLNNLITTDSNQSKYNLNNAQQNFTLTKELKYLTSFTINGSDYIGYTDYNTAAVTYSPPVLNGYTISSSDTVTITYWYEE